MKPRYTATQESALPLRVAIYVPSRTKAGAAQHRGITQDDLLKVVLNFFTFEFGGATAIEAQGYFVHPTRNDTQEEAVTIVYANSTKQIIETFLPTIEELANDLAVRLDQTSVAFEIGETMYFAAPTKYYRSLNNWLLPQLLSSKLEHKRGWSKYVDIAPLVIDRKKRERAKTRG